MNALLGLAEAQARLLDDAAALPAERVPIDRSVGRYTAEAVTSVRTQPAGDLSAMDGYAMADGNLAGPWRVIGESAAGRPYAGTLGPADAVRISTGALMPAGASVVLLQENAQRTADTLALNGQGEPSPRHVRRKGFDFAAGDILLAPGLRIGPAQLALALSGGRSALAVHALPSLAVIDSGDELATDPRACSLHQIPASNGAMLAAMAAPHAARVSRIGPVRDKTDALLAAFGRAGEADVIVTTGGASVGDHDLVRPALEQWGAELDFWRVAIKPGKPLLVARRGRQIVLGLPGNPVSSYVTAFLFLLPLLRKLGGAIAPLPRAISLPVASALAATSDRMEFLRGTLGPAGAHPVTEQDSSALAALSRAELLIQRPANAPAAAPGELVQGYWLENGGIA